MYGIGIQHRKRLETYTENVGVLSIQDRDALSFSINVRPEQSRYGTKASGKRGEQIRAGGRQAVSGARTTESDPREEGSICY